MRKTQFSKKQKTAVVGGTVAALMAGGVALAAWSSNGTGDGTVTAGRNVSFTVTDGQSATALVPNNDTVVKFNVKNNNPYKVQLSTLHINSFTVDQAHSDAGCTVATSGVTTTDSTPADVLGASGASDDTAVISAPVHMNANSDNACQGATFTFSGTATGSSVN